MQFLFPGFLWALALLSVPIIIHLFHFRRFKRVYFTNVHLLQELKEETSSKNRLKNILVLLSRLLALAALIFAFAQPLLRHGDTSVEEEATVAIYIDNSYSMQSEIDDVPLLTVAKDRAIEIINAYGAAEQFILLTNELSAKSQRLVDQKTAIQFAQDISPSSEVADLSDIIAVADRVSRRYAAEKSLQLYLLSDFQENITLADTPADSTIVIDMIPLRSIREDNIALTSAKLEAPVALQNVRNTIVVELKNYSDTEQEVPLRMDYGNRSQPLGVIRLPASATVIDSIYVSLLPQEWHDITLSIDDYPVEFDNTLYLSMQTKENIQVLNIYETQPNANLKSAAESITSIQLEQNRKEAIRYESFARQDLILLEDLTSISSGLRSELVKYLRAGGKVFISPNKNADISSYNMMLQAINADRLTNKTQDSSQQVTFINTEDFVFTDVYRSTQQNLLLPSTKLRYKLQHWSRTDRNVIMSYRDGAPFLSKYNVDGGQLYLCSAPMNSDLNSLSNQAEIYLPMIYKMSLSSNISAPLDYTIGVDNIIEINAPQNTNDTPYKMEGPLEFIPVVSKAPYKTLLNVTDQITAAGHYTLSKADKSIAHMAYNYDRIESDMSYAPLEQVASRIGSNVSIVDNTMMADLSRYIVQKDEGQPLWRWFLFGALLFLLIESLLLRYWK